MTDEQLELVLMGYGLEYVIEIMDIEPLTVLLLLEEQGLLDVSKLKELVN